MNALSDEQFINVGRILVDLIELLEKPSPFTPTCSCGWTGESCEDEADATAQCWAHAPCFGPYLAQCSDCDWRGRTHIETADAWSELAEHRASAHSAVSSIEDKP